MGPLLDSKRPRADNAAGGIDFGQIPLQRALDEPPLFGSQHAFITASRNYLEVVFWHSVIVIVPMFVVWAWLLARYRFTPSSVVVLFGINGVLAELLIGGPALLMAPFWIFVYGLMIFLPAYSFAMDAATPKPRWYHYLAAIGACLLASAAVALVVNLLSPHLPHFGSTLAFPKIPS